MFPEKAVGFTTMVLKHESMYSNVSVIERLSASAA